MSPFYELPPDQTNIAIPLNFMGKYEAFGGDIRDFQFLMDHKDSMKAVVQFVTELFDAQPNASGRVSVQSVWAGGRSSIELEKSPDLSHLGKASVFRYSYIEMGGRDEHFGFLVKNELAMKTTIELVLGLRQLEKKKREEEKKEREKKEKEKVD